MYLRAHGDFYQAIDASLSDLKDQVAAAVGQPIRRISRFMQLALIGAGRCARDQPLPKNTAVYLASGRGDLEITIDVLNHVFREAQAPKPLSFVNTVSNSAAFYVAKCLQLEARSCFVCNKYFAFESALQLAIADFKMGAIDSALVGAVEGAVAPLSTHRERLQLKAGDALAEASHWIWLSRTSLGDRELMPEVYFASDRTMLDRWLSTQSFDAQTTQISGGLFLTSADLQELKEQTGIASEFSYRESRGYYDSQSAAACSEFAAAQGADVLLHINADPLGRYAAMMLRRAIVL